MVEDLDEVSAVNGLTACRAGIVMLAGQGNGFGVLILGYQPVLMFLGHVWTYTLAAIQ